MMKTFSKLEIKENFLDLKNTYRKPTAYSTLNGKRLNVLSLESRTMLRMVSLTTLIQCNTRSPSECNKARKTNKRMQFKEKEIQLFLSTDDMIIYKTKFFKLPELITDFDRTQATKSRYNYIH